MNPPESIQPLRAPLLAFLPDLSNTQRRLVSVAGPLLAFAALMAPIAAQCAPSAIPGDGQPGIDGDAAAFARWDPDGVGSAPEVLVVAGSFSEAGGVAVNSVAVWDGTRWSALPSAFGFDNAVLALQGMPNGDLIAAGAFTTVDGIPAQGIASWNGTSWSALGGSMDNTVSALALLPNGDLVAGGTFTTAGGVSAAGIARWDGSTWSTLGLGVSGSVSALAVRTNGDLIVGGDFTQAGGIAATSLARFDGTNWAVIGGLPGGSSVLGLLALANGDVIVSGGFNGGFSNIARWDGNTLNALGAGQPVPTRAMTQLPNGNLLVANPPVTGNTVTVRQWNGAQWTASAFGTFAPSFGTFAGVGALLAMPNGDVYAGGTFQTVGGAFLRNIARLRNGQVQPVGNGFSLEIKALAIAANGDLVAGGTFQHAGGVRVNNVARRSGANWSALGAGTNGVVNAVLALPNGEIVIAGDFTTAGGINASRVARWNGSTWQAMGAGPNIQVLALARMPNGDIIAGGASIGGSASRIARWNGTTWVSLGGPNGTVHALAPAFTGELFVGGDFQSVPGAFAHNVARWTGAVWTGLGTGLNARVLSLTFDFNQGLVAGGDFTQPQGGGASLNRIARFTGTNWLPLGSGANGPVQAIGVLPQGDLIVGGNFNSIGGAPAGGLARFTGNTWTAVPGGSRANALAVQGNGQVAIATQSIPFFAETSLPCPARVSLAGAGCPSSGGSNRLSAANLPWVETTVTVRATGLPPASIVATILGVTPVVPPIPLSTLVVGGVPGCDVHALADVEFASLASDANGNATRDFFLPNTPPLVGVVFFMQWLPFESVGGSFVVTSTNGLRFLAGSL